VRGQVNYLGATGQGFGASDWDLFYDPLRYVKANEIRKSKFRLLMPLGAKGVLDWEADWSAIVATVRDVDIGYTAVNKAGKLHNYLGRINPAPRCDGKPPIEYQK
jgi:hypothetical protein